MKNIHNTDQTIQILTGLGLEPKQAQIYIAALEKGGGSISDLARAAGIERTNVYYHIGRLLELGLLNEARTGKRSRYIASDPATFKELLVERTKELEAALPHLSAQFQRHSTKSAATYFEGRDGIISLYEAYYRILKSMPPNAHFMVITRNVTAVDALPDYLPKFVARRMKLPIKTRGIFPVSEKLSPKQKIDPNDLAQVLRHNINTTKEKKYMPDKYMPESTVLIFGKHVVMVDWKNMFGSLVENQVLADTWSKFFEFAWDNLPKVD